MLQNTHSGGKTKCSVRIARPAALRNRLLIRLTSGRYSSPRLKSRSKRSSSLAIENDAPARISSSASADSIERSMEVKSMRSTSANFSSKPRLPSYRPRSACDRTIETEPSSRRHSTESTAATSFNVKVRAHASTERLSSSYQMEGQTESITVRPSLNVFAQFRSSDVHSP
jgi:hypothetical protein